MIRERERWILLAPIGVLLFAVCWMAPHNVRDADVLSRLAMGRWLWDHGAFPARDPFTFSSPDVPFGDPEWLGDALFFGVYRLFGEGGLQAATIGIACAGYLLSFCLGRRWGASTGIMLAILLCSLPAAAPRVNARNDVHLLWLFPLFGLLASRARQHACAWYGIAACFAFWANLHSSFVAGAALLAVAVIAQPRPRPLVAWIVLAACPCLPWLGLAGSSTYRQLIDHALGAPVYRAWLSEWQSPLTSSGVLAIAPLHAVCTLGVACAFVNRKRLDALQVSFFILGCALSYSSRRFLPAMAYLIAPAVGPWLSEVLTTMKVKWQRVARGAGSVLVLAYVTLAARSFQSRADNSMFERESGPRSAVDFLVNYASHGANVFNSFNDGPWLTWFGAGRFRHYVDPRNQAGASALARYTRLLVDHSAFDAEAARLQIDFALLPLLDPQLRLLAQHLGDARAWMLVYWDGGRALYARRGKETEVLAARFAYRVLRPTLDLRYLEAKTVDEGALVRDLAQLDSQAPLEARVIRAYRALSTGDRALAARAAQVIRSAWPYLADVESLQNALSELDVRRSP